MASQSQIQTSLNLYGKFWSAKSKVHFHLPHPSEDVLEVLLLKEKSNIPLHSAPDSSGSICQQSKEDRSCYETKGWLHSLCVLVVFNILSTLWGIVYYVCICGCFAWHYHHGTAVIKWQTQISQFGVKHFTPLYFCTIELHSKVQHLRKSCSVPASNWVDKNN